MANLTEKGKLALNYIKEFYPKGKFTAADLSLAAGEKIVAATLNSLVAKDFLLKYPETSPIKYEVKQIPEDLNTLINNTNISKNENLHRALKNKNDEFYTMYIDIQKECQYYESYFENKRIYLNCDNEDSNFWKYFLDNFSRLKLKSLTATSLSKKKLYTEDGNIITTTILTGTGAFDSAECIQLLDVNDIVITNPPFSLFRKLACLLQEHNLLFLIIGNENTFASTEIFPMIKNHTIWTGYNKVKTFVLPSGDTQTFGNICWFTNLPVKKDIPFIPLTRPYNETFYKKYENYYTAINVDKVIDIPKDYDGIIGVPISILNKINFDQFELLGLAAGNSKNNKLYFSVEYIPSPLDRGGCGVVDGVRKYSRVFIKKKG